MTKIKNISATNPLQKTRKVATKKENSSELVTSSPPVRYAFVPIVQEFRKHTKKNDARLWIPIETSLLVRYEFASCSLQTRYVFVAIVLFCGANGIDVIPLDAKFMSSVLVADERTITKCFEELLSKNLLQEREREREEEKKKTDRQTGDKSRVCVSDFNSFEEEIQDEEKESSIKRISPTPNSNGNLSQFSMEECKRYVELCQSKGDQIANPRALATNLFRSGESDAFILGMLYPERVKELNIETFGNPIAFTDSPCSVCFGGKMSDLDGKGYSACKHCRNERGNATGYEPKEAKQ